MYIYKATVIRVAYFFIKHLNLNRLTLIIDVIAKVIFLSLPDCQQTCGKLKKLQAQ